MKTISIRLEDHVFDEIETRRGNVNKSDYYREIVDYYLQQFDDDRNTTEDRLITKYEQEITYLRSENTKLLELLNQAQILQLQSQKLLTESTSRQSKPRWWYFWERHM